MLIYFVRGSLPWQGLKTTSRAEKYRRVLEMKRAVRVDELCEGLPPAFVTYMTYVCTLSEDDMPDYRYLRKLFRQLFRRQRFQHDHVYDWTILEFIRQDRAEALRRD